MTDDIEVVEGARQAVGRRGDEVLARQTAEEVAADAGFDEGAAGEVGLVAAELASNVRKHAGDGELTVSRIRDGERAGVRVESHDAGPGITDVDGAFADGTSTAGSLGGGLGTVNRLMDRVTVAAPGEPDYGTHVVADRWCRPTHEATTECPLSFGAASRPRTAGDANGDTFVIKRWNDSALVGVVDGLGHGGSAHEASMAAKEYVERHYDRPMADIFEGTERACRGTRGVVMALARFDWAAGTVTFATVGNINHKDDADLHVVPRRGVLGSDGPEPAVTRSDWGPENRLVLFSDGVGSRWDLSDHDALFEDPATVVARGLLNRHGKDHDDATVLVVGGTTTEG